MHGPPSRGAGEDIGIHSLCSPRHFRRSWASWRSRRFACLIVSGFSACGDSSSVNARWPSPAQSPLAVRADTPLHLHAQCRLGPEASSIALGCFCPICSGLELSSVLNRHLQAGFRHIRRRQILHPGRQSITFVRFPHRGQNIIAGASAHSWLLLSSGVRRRHCRSEWIA